MWDSEERVTKKIHLADIVTFTCVMPMLFMKSVLSNSMKFKAALLTRYLDMLNRTPVEN